MVFKKCPKVACLAWLRFEMLRRLVLKIAQLMPGSLVFISNCESRVGLFLLCFSLFWWQYGSEVHFDSVQDAFAYFDFWRHFAIIVDENLGVPKNRFFLFFVSFFVTFFVDFWRNSWILYDTANFGALRAWCLGASFCVRLSLGNSVKHQGHANDETLKFCFRADFFRLFWL